MNVWGQEGTPSHGQMAEVGLYRHSLTESHLPEEGTIIIPIFQEGKLRHRAGKLLGQSHPARN